MKSAQEIDIKVIHTAYHAKPEFGQPCNHCGWCCMTEVCAIGQELAGSDKAPCPNLEKHDDGFMCGLAEIPAIAQAMSMGVGCDAKTQTEILKELK